ncbi:MAG TPA: septum formation initiator family protein [Vicinamibacterales bacterium]|jgi:cell division protein FtsB|nr:septum formation initiator family protein [Vicinamibacterales bacterium]
MIRPFQTSSRDPAATSAIAQKDRADPRVPRQRGPRRRFWSHAMLFAACVLLVNGLFGERSLLESIRARRAYDRAARDLARLKQENADLRDQARRLRNDPATIESVARGDLGLLRAGEILVTVRDVK